jgi:hypothetical protein
MTLQQKENPMAKAKRAYYLPGKLISAFDKECRKSGYVREKVVAAAVFAFLQSDPDARAKMFEGLAKFVSGKAK